MAPVDESSVSAREQLELIRRVIRKRWLMVGVLALITGLAAFGTTKLLSPVYEASTTVRILRQQVLAEDRASARSQRDTGSLFAEASWLTSSLVLTSVIQRLALADSSPGSPLEASLTRVKNTLKGFMGRPVREDTRALELMDRLRRKCIKIKELEGFNALEIRVQWHDPEMTMRLANSLVDVFIERFQEASRGATLQKRQYLEAQVQLVRTQLNDSEKNLADFQKETGMVSPDDRQIGLPAQVGLQQLMVEKRQVELQLASATAELEQIDARLAARDAGKKSGTASLRAALKNPTSMLRTLLSEAISAEAEVAKNKSLYTEKGIAGSRAVRDLEAIKVRLGGELKQLGADPAVAMDDLFVMVQQEELDSGISESLLARLQIDRDSLTARIKPYQVQLTRLEAEIGQAKTDTQNLPDELQKYMALTREKRVNEELYTRLCAQLSGAQVDENSSLYDVRVFEAAHLPTKPIKPKPMLMTGLGLFLGFLLGVCVAFSLEYLNDSLRSSQEVQHYLGLPVLAEIPKVRLRKRLAPARDLSKVAAPL